MKKLLAPLLLAVATTGCITEVDVGSCNNAVLEFKYFADGDDDVFPEYINSVTCAVYDSNGTALLETTLSQSDLQAFQGLKMRLDATGDYRVVAWGNIGQETSVDKGSGYLGAVNTAHSAGQAVRTHDPLYLGTLDFTIKNTGERKEMEVIFHSAHITFIAELEPGPASTSPSDYSISIGKFPVAVDHTGATGGEKVHFSPAFERAEILGLGAPAMYTARCELPRFKEDTESEVIVRGKDSDEVLATVNLPSYLATNHILITTREEVIVRMLIRTNGTQITIKMPDWKQDDVIPQI